MSKYVTPKPPRNLMIGDTAVNILMGTADRLVDDASISVQLLAKEMNAEAIAADPKISGVLIAALHAFAAKVACGRERACPF